MRKTWQEFKRRKARGDEMRPIWQIAILLPVAIVAQASQSLMDWLDNKFNPIDPNFWSDDNV